jgi:hypothetical protein
MGGGGVGDGPGCDIAELNLEHLRMLRSHSSCGRSETCQNTRDSSCIERLYAALGGTAA